MTRKLTSIALRARMLKRRITVEHISCMDEILEDMDKSFVELSGVIGSTCNALCEKLDEMEAMQSEFSASKSSAAAYAAAGAAYSLVSRLRDIEDEQKFLDSVAALIDSLSSERVARSDLPSR